MTGVAFIVGALTNVYFFNTTGQISFLAAGKQVDSIIPLFIEKTMPSWFSILFLVTLFAAAMSTMSSQYHTIGTALSRDIFETITQKRETMGLNRIGTSIGIILSTLLGWGLPRFYGLGSEIIARGTSIFFGLCASTLLPMYIGALYSRRITKAGAIAGMVTGFITSMFWFLFVHEKESQVLGVCQALFGRGALWGLPWKVVDPIVIALPLAAFVTLIVSYCTKPPEEVHLKTSLSAFSASRAAQAPFDPERRVF